MFSTIKEDISNVFERDPAARNWWEVITCYPGLHAIWGYRLAHVMWQAGLHWPARFLSHVVRAFTGIEIHPGARIGRCFFIDHGMGIVIGETAEIGDDVLMYKGAVLGGTSLNKGKRHPTIGHDVVIGSDAVVLGPITVGDRARIGSGAVVIKSVPADSTAVGVPARVVRGPTVEDTPCGPLEHGRMPDPIERNCRQMKERMDDLESQIARLEQQLRTLTPNYASSAE